MKIEDYTLLYKEKRVTEKMNLMQNLMVAMDLRLHLTFCLHLD